MNNVIEIPLGMGTKVFLLKGQAGAVLVDAGTPGQANRVLSGLAKHGIAPQDVRLILITHGHLDHFGSARELRERTGAPVAVHAGDAEALRAGVNPAESSQPTSMVSRLLMGVGLRMVSLDPSSALEPDLVFEAPWRLDDYGVAAQVLLTPGHTPGSISILLDSGEAIAGDIVVGDLLLRRPATPFVAWDLPRNWDSLRQLLAHTPRIIYITHGGPFTPGQLETLLRSRQ